MLQECRPLALVSLHVKCQVVGAGEAAVTHPTLERLCPRVFPEMASQLIGTSEAPLTSLPGAPVRLLSFRERHTTHTARVEIHSP